MVETSKTNAKADNDAFIKTPKKRVRATLKSNPEKKNIKNDINNAKGKSVATFLMTKPKGTFEIARRTVKNKNIKEKTTNEVFASSTITTHKEAKAINFAFASIWCIGLFICEYLSTNE